MHPELRKHVERLATEAGELSVDSVVDGNPISKSALNPETDRTESDIEAIRSSESYIRSTLGSSGYLLPDDLASDGATEARIASITSDHLMQLQAEYGLRRVGYVNLSRDYTHLNETILREKIGYVDEDSFAFVWGLLGSVSPIASAAPKIEQHSIALVAHLRKFIEDTSTFQETKNDPRMQGPLHLYAAVELSANRDYSAALNELEQIPEEPLRELYKGLLETTISRESTTITPDESRKNLRQLADSLEYKRAFPEEVKTRIASNHSLETFQKMFDPMSSGRIYASAEHPGADLPPATRGPSSGDLDGRRIPSETLLGHPRQLFAARVIYGSLLTTEELAQGSDMGWAFGKARFVLKEGSRTTADASFTYGDSLNGTALRNYRILLRPEANIASKIYSEVFSERQRQQFGVGNTEQYIEAQFDGLSIPDIESIILRPGPVGRAKNDVLSEVAETAALHGITVDYIFNWADIAARHSYMPADESNAAQAFIQRLQELKMRHPHVTYMLEISEDKKRMFEMLDQTTATLTTVHQ